jgi:hypothetical protein
MEHASLALTSITCSTRVGSSLTRKHWTSLKNVPGTNTLAYFSASEGKKKQPSKVECLSRASFLRLV